MFFLPRTYETVDHIQYVRDDNVDEFQVLSRHLPADYSFGKFALHFIHQDGYKIFNDKLGCFSFFWPRK